LDVEIHWRNGIPSGITGSWARIQNCKITNLPIGNNSGTLTLKDLYRLKQIFKYENLIKMREKILIRHYYE
jgi:hypothetical protein